MFVSCFLVSIPWKQILAHRAAGTAPMQASLSGSEMEKRADAADTSVLFFSLAVLIFWIYMHKLDENTVLLMLC